MALRILLVEDEPLIAMHLEDIVADLGHAVCGVVADAGAAVSMAGKDPPPDVAFVCIDLAVREDILPTILRLREDRGVALVFIGASWDDRTGRLAAIVSPEALLPKPFQSSHVEAALRKIENSCRKTS